MTKVKDSPWTIKRQECFYDDGFECQSCGKIVNLVVHRLNYERAGDDYTRTNLITVCKSCHEQLHKQRRN